jgi:hypothetical protein
MMGMFRLRPAGGLRIKDPAHGDHLPPEGREVNDSPYWRRLLRNKNVIVMGPPEKRMDLPSGQDGQDQAELLPSAEMPGSEGLPAAEAGDGPVLPAEEEATDASLGSASGQDVSLPSAKDQDESLPSAGGGQDESLPSAKKGRPARKKNQQD